MLYIVLIFTNHFVWENPWGNDGKYKESDNNRDSNHNKLLLDRVHQRYKNTRFLFNFLSKKIENRGSEQKKGNFDSGMKKFIIIAGVAAVVIAGVLMYYRHYAKSFSPESDVDFEADGLKIHINYNRPYKKGRVIFGGLEPYGKVWRTGANEATTIEINKDIKVKGNLLKAGSYSLFTIPGEQTWSVIFNSETGQWGINFDGIANRDPKNDVLTVEVPAVQQEKVIEQFTISIERMGEDMEIVLLWDKTLVSIPFSR
jgi:Protein of unknown function (DUF2911)